MLEATGIASKALSVGNKVAPVLGAISGWTAPMPEGDMSTKLQFVVDAVKGFKIADPLKTTQIALSQPGRYPIASGLGLYITGHIIDLIGDAAGVNTVSRMGGIAKKGGASAAINSLVASYIYEAKNNPSGSSNRTSTGPSVPGRTPAAQSTIIRDNPQGLQRYMPGGNVYYSV